MHRVVVLSRAGEQTLDPSHRHLIATMSRLRFIRRDHPPGTDDAARLLRDADVLVTTNLCLPALDDALLTRCPRLRRIVLFATGYDHVDAALLARHGVGLTTLPHYATIAVAEHALAMMLALSARIPLAHDRCRGLVAASTSLRGVELADRTLGIVGTGLIGRRLARLATGIGMRTVGCDVDGEARAAARACGIDVQDHRDLARSSDVVAVCASRLPGTPPIVDADVVDLLRPGCLLVSVARPCRVDTAAVVASIRAGRLRGYAVDDVVLDPGVDGDLLAEGRVIQTGHSAWWRDESLRRGRQMLGEAVLTTLAALTDVEVAS